MGISNYKTLDTTVSGVLFCLKNYKLFTFSSFILQKYYNLIIIIDNYGISDRIITLDIFAIQFLHKN